MAVEFDSHENDHSHENRQFRGGVVIFMGYLNTLTKTANFYDGVWSTLMKISFRGGIYIILIKMINFMSVSFELS